MKLYRIHGREESRCVPATLLDLHIGDPGRMDRRRGTTRCSHPGHEARERRDGGTGTQEAGSAAPCEGAPSLVGRATFATGSLGAIAVSSETVKTSSPFAFLAL